MKMERISQDKIRIYLTFDDLTERGIHKDDMWREIPKVHELFSEMMDQAYAELGFDADGPLAVEVLAMPAQGMLVIVTRGQMEFRGADDLEDELDDVYELEVTLDEASDVMFAFRDFEDLLRAAKAVNSILAEGGKLFAYKELYILQLQVDALEEKTLQTAAAVLSEYGETVPITSAVLEEYGKLIIAENAVQMLCNKFA